MRFDREFRHPQGVDRALTALREIVRETGPIRLMEICGTHTMAIAKSGLRSLLPEGLSLIPCCAAGRSAHPFTPSILRWKRFRWRASIRTMR